jgi:hypothetical protein
MTGEFFGMHLSARHMSMIVALLAAFAAAPVVAHAQDAPAQVDQVAPADQPQSADAEISPEDSALLGKILTFDAATPDSPAPVKKLRLPSLPGRPGLNIVRTDKSDGSSTVVLKQPLPTEWDAQVGADLGVAANTAESYQRGQPLPGSNLDRNSGAAWASVGVVRNIATVDARVDPSNDQGKLGTTLKHSVPLGSEFAVTVQNSFSVTETFSAAPSAASDLPLMTAPVATGTPTPQIWGNEKAAKFDVLPTGTSFGVKVASLSNDPVTHNTLSAEQKIYGPLRVTTAMTDVGQQSASRSISAGFKLNW